MISPNLIPFGELTEAEQRRIRSMGGKASVKKRKEIKTLKQIAQEFGQMQVNKETIAKFQALFPDLKKDTVAKTLLVATAYKKAIKGEDVQAMRFIAEVEGETKSQQVVTPIQIVINGEDKNC